jgi:iron(III) transport system ATP-binding protein
MTTADLIAVMNGGKIEQSGTPEDIYDAPRSEFVARFIGAANVMKGKALDAEHVAVAGIPLRCTGNRLNAGTETAVAIRQHEIALSSAPPSAQENVMPATVARQVFLGSSRDYMVSLADGVQLRVAAPPSEIVPQGSPVWLHLPPDRCRALSG